MDALVDGSRLTIGNKMEMDGWIGSVTIFSYKIYIQSLTLTGVTSYKEIAPRA
jgi:hypothetical protein